jgi:hypothetical protein
MHIRDYQCTTASMVVEVPADPDDAPHVWASLGTPCTGVFVPIGLFAGSRSTQPTAVVSRLLGDAAAWRAFAALGRQVEAPGEQGAEALTAIRAVFDPLEASLWEEAASLHATRADRASWEQAADRWTAQLASALTELAT